MARPYAKRRYIQHDWTTQKEFDLSPTEALTIGLIAGLSINTGWSYASKVTLADIVNISVPTLNNTIRRLKDKRLIVEDIENRGPKNVKMFAPTNKWWDSVYVDEIL
ncbi:helix-turn-helix domain-containing protein [Patescibacteria group bacterium]|nr:helix-turn-helix domain-containing protein [Patescibacteria group bacterium]